MMQKTGNPSNQIADEVLPCDSHIIFGIRNVYFINVRNNQAWSSSQHTAGDHSVLYPSGLTASYFHYKLSFLTGESLVVLLVH